jgi:hypothetical protein
MSATAAYSGLRSELESIRDEAVEHRRDGVRLYHDLLLAPGGDPWDETVFDRITEAEHKRDAALWESWSIWPEGDIASRFWGQKPESKGYVSAFMLLLERVTSTLDEFQRLADSGELLPRRVKLTALNNQIGFYRGHGPKWVLELIHKWAFRFPTTGLRGECRWWEMDADPLAAQQGKDDDEPPIHNVLFHNVFTALAAFLDMCLRPDHADPFLIWDHLPELYLPDEDAPVRPNRDWMWKELAYLSDELRYHRELLRAGILPINDMPPHQIGILIVGLRNFVQHANGFDSDVDSDSEHDLAPLTESIRRV